MAYEINYNDKRFTEVETDKREALTELENTYGGMINSADKYYDNQINASKEYAETQKKNQQAMTDFAIEQIEQDKAQAKKDYIKEQSGAYVDWQKQSNPYGVQAEQMAANGLKNSGFRESSLVSMYNTYQNRVATARESYNQAVLNYNNSIKDARLQNNSVLAEIAYKALQKQLELSLEGFQYKNKLIQDKADKELTIKSFYADKYQKVLDQINEENSLTEKVRQYNETMALQSKQFDWQKEQASKPSSSIVKNPSKSPGGSSGVKKPELQGPPYINTYKKAVAYLKSKGISGDGGLMTKGEWARRKASGSKTAETAYSSYVEYLKNFIAYRLRKK